MKDYFLIMKMLLILLLNITLISVILLKKDLLLKRLRGCIKPSNFCDYGRPK